MGRPLIYAAMTKAGYLFLLTAFANSVTWQKAVALIWDPALVKRIEVVRGPNSSLYGSGGLGGVVDFRTADAADFLPPGKSKRFKSVGKYRQW